MSATTSRGPVPITTWVSDPAELADISGASNDTVESDTGCEKKPTNDVQVQLHYLKDDPLYKNTKPLQIVPEWRDTERMTNVQLEAGPKETLHDVRGHEGNFSLDAHGFKYVYAPTTFKDWSSQPEIGRVHLPELENLLRKEVKGADEILFYDARLRQETETGVKVSGLSYKPFARQVHTDNTESSVISKIHNLTDLKAEYYLQGRVRIINIWRPIKHPVYDCGLAVANGAKLQEDDVIECDRVRADTGKFWDTMGVIKHREGFEWHYMSLQDEPDVLLFKNYDSATDVNARWCLHTAFDLPAESIPPDAPTRESIEVRALVFTLPEGLRRPSSLGMLQHPLAEQLAQEQLPLVDEAHCITDHLRTDIDEGGEMKDAMLMLRRNEMRRMQRVNDDLKTELESTKAERERLATDLEAANRQIDIQKNYAAGLQQQIEAMKQHRQSPKSPAPRADSPQELRPGVMKELHETRQYAELQKAEIERWKGEAMRRESVAVSRSWQASVDEAVRREREKDAVVFREKDGEIRALREQVERLRDASRC